MRLLIVICNIVHQLCSINGVFLLADCCCWCQPTWWWLLWKRSRHSTYVKWECVLRIEWRKKINVSPTSWLIFSISSLFYHWLTHTFSGFRNEGGYFNISFYLIHKCSLKFNWPWNCLQRKWFGFESYWRINSGMGLIQITFDLSV